MKISNILFPGLFLCFAAVSCQKDDMDSQNAANRQIADYLYAVEYDDYDFQANLAFFNEQLMPDYPGCSEVRKGRFVGRNLDWYINNDASVIIKINHTDDHYASIGMTGCFPDLSNALAKSGEFLDAYRYLPFKTVDGINEKGLYIGINVAPTGETSFDPSTWEPHSYGHGAAHTNPSSDMHCCVNYLVRIVLDRAGSVEEAMDVIAGIDWTEPADFPQEGVSQAFHWLICDSEKSVVLEFMDNEAVYTIAPDNSEPSLGNIMTNFTNCLMEKGLIQKCGCGLERWDILNDNYASTPVTFEGMQELMKKVWYTNAYTIDPSSHDFWFTEWCDGGFSSIDMYRNYALCDNAEFVEGFRDFLKIFDDPDNWHSDDTPLWYTTHTSIYDLESKSFRVLVHEGRDGQQDYYEVSLENSHFPKPLNSVE